MKKLMFPSHGKPAGLRQNIKTAGKGSALAITRKTRLSLAEVGDLKARKSSGKVLTGLVPVYILLLLIIVCFTGCGRTADEKSGQIKFLIGMSQANLIEPWRVTMNNEIEEEASKHKDLKVIFRDATMDSSKQIKDVKELLQEGIDLLIISPNDTQDITPIVTEAYKKIPVIVLDRAVEGYNYTLFIGPDNNLIGKKAGEFVADLLGSKGGNVIEVQGLSGSPPVIDRSTGLKEVLKQHNNINITDTVVGDWLPDKAEDELKASLSKNPNTDVIFAQNDAMALGAYRALRDLHMKNVKIVGVDGLYGTNGGLEMVKNGILSGTFTCPTGGKEAIQYAIDILNHESGIPKKIILRSEKITKDNVLSYLDKKEQPQANKEEQVKNIVLGFALVGNESSWRAANTESIIKAAGDEGIDLRIINAGGSQEKQIEAIRSFIQQKVDVIDFSPLVETGWDEVLKEAKAAGIPVICSDRTVKVSDDSLYSTFIGSDFVEEGRRAANWLADYTRGRPEVNIVEIQGTEGSAPAIERKEGFEQVINNFSNLKIIDSSAGEFTVDSGRRIMEAMLKANGKKINAVFAHNDDMALGAIQAIENYGLRPGKDIIVVSIDGVKDAFKAMVAGKLNCTVECNPLLGPQLMKAVKDYESGKSLPLRIITSEGVFPAETARKELNIRKY